MLINTLPTSDTCVCADGGVVVLLDTVEEIEGSGQAINDLF